MENNPGKIFIQKNQENLKRRGEQMTYGIYSLNCWAVLIAAIVAFLVGWLWYGPLFGKEWRKLAKKTKKQAKPEPGALVLSFLTYIVMAFVLGLLINLTGMGGLLNGAGMGLLVWFGFLATKSMGMVLWDKKPWQLWFMDNAYMLVMMILMGLILGGC